MARLKTDKRRTPSSRAWLQRQLSDPYVARAKREGYRSRAAFKLAEIDDKFHLLKKGARVVDLGAAPGGWSEIAANTTGHRQTDHLRIVALAEAAAEFAREVLASGGSFLCKVLQGGTEAALLAALKRDFASVKHIKPPASRTDSAELYLLARGFRRKAAPGAGGTV